MQCKYLALAGLVVLFAAPAIALLEGYIDRERFNVTAILPAAPVEGSDRYELDRRIFRSTRALANTPRWAMAVNDVQLDADHMMADFNCATGIRLIPETAPRLTRIPTKASNDSDAETAMAKSHFKRFRPFQIDSGAICEPASDVERTYDYLSGHTTQGWTWAMILAELMPDRAASILARGRAFGESRVVWGVHNASAVEAGRTSASATLSELRATRAYRDDFEAARAELKRLRTSGSLPDAALCRAEADLVAQDIFAPVGSAAP